MSGTQWRHGLACRLGQTLAGGSAGNGGGISAGVAGGVDDGGGTAYVGSSPIQSGTGTNTASVGCTEGGGGRLVGVDNPSFCCCSSCGNEVVSLEDLLLVGGNAALVARPYDWREWYRISLMVGRTSARNACSSTIDARDHLPSPSIGRSCPAPQRYPICPTS